VFDKMCEGGYGMGLMQCMRPKKGKFLVVWGLGHVWSGFCHMGVVISCIEKYNRK
jgi:hypothetical protein